VITLGSGHLASPAAQVHWQAQGSTVAASATSRPDTPGAAAAGTLREAAAEGAAGGGLECRPSDGAGMAQRGLERVTVGLGGASGE
jgi:hypothetical protein